MIDGSAVAEIIATYKKYGWLLRRVLLTAQSKAVLLQNNSYIFEGIETIDSTIDAAWFSRPPSDAPSDDYVAWEIRYLGDFPFALLERVDEKDPKFDNILNSLELRLRETISSKISA